VLLALARYQAIIYPQWVGTPNLVRDAVTGATRVGRFGWKAQVATLREFAGDAYLNELGITNPLFPDENAPQGDRGALAFNPAPQLNDNGEDVESFINFISLLGPPPPGNRGLVEYYGSLVFLTSGCASCHTPTLITGPSPVRALSRKAFHPYSDFLLHDMGSLGDGIAQGSARGNQIRTAPLWGLKSRSSFLHDGRATTPDAAIMAHSGQAGSSRDRYARLGGFGRAALLAYLKSL
jgi:CxxC motif-containing protein (DUF1111 family)